MPTPSKPRLTLDGSVTYASVERYKDYYRIGDDGSAWSIRRGFWEQLACAPDSNGYPRVNFVKKDKTHASKKMHQLVMEIFVGPCPPGMEVCHNDRNKLNNRISNLRYGTRKENSDDRYKHKTTPRGEIHVQSVLTEPDVLAIRAVKRKPGIINRLTSYFSASRYTIKHIRNNNSWKYLIPGNYRYAPIRTPDE